MTTPDKLSETDALRLLLAHARLANIRGVVSQQEYALRVLMEKHGLCDGDQVSEDGTVTRAPRP